MGSSPRVWGQVSSVTAFQSLPWIIPTRMGTSCPHSPSRSRLWDHPHAYGDKNVGRKKCRRGVGSSPRVWGQEQLAARQVAILRIIPTRMGTSKSFACRAVVKKDHPHAYGDKYTLRQSHRIPTGSSPRVWGQGFGSNLIYFALGIIPTRMGTSVFAVTDSPPRRDHPHAYGDKRFRINRPYFAFRIIPTRMGTSQSGIIKRTST